MRTAKSVSIIALIAVLAVAVQHVTRADDQAKKKDSAHEHRMTGDMGKDMRMMNDMMVKHLGKKDADYEKRFIDMMIPHHEGAIRSAKHAMENSNRPELKEMAKMVIDEQQKEIDKLKKWRQEWYSDAK